jgi:hypothetical protein
MCCNGKVSQQANLSQFAISRIGSNFDGKCSQACALVRLLKSGVRPVQRIRAMVHTSQLMMSVKFALSAFIHHVSSEETAIGV